MRSRLLILLAALVLIGAVFTTGVYVGYSERPFVRRLPFLASQDLPSELTAQGNIDFAPFWKAWAILEEKYVDPDAIDRQKLVWGSIVGLANGIGDPYTQFFPPEEEKAFNEQLSGEFEGIGAEIGMRNGKLTVIAPLEGSPAQRAGLKSGDLILKIDADDATSLSVDAAVKKIRGKGGTVVKLTIFRESETDTKEISITRDNIIVPVITTKTVDDAFVIQLYSFSANSPGSFRDAILAFSKSGKQKLILDLRNNPGGFLEAAVSISSWFVPEGKVVVSEKIRGQDDRIHRSAGYAEVSGLKMVVLINGGSASASEIVAGALQDHGIATIVGTQSFGKGSVQEVVPVTDDTSLKVTIAKWFTPNGGTIAGKGITPSVLVSDEDLKAMEKDPLNDVYIKAALQALK